MSIPTVINPWSVGHIPDGWDVRTIESLCQKVTSGGTPLRSRSEFYENGTINWFKTGELHDWYLDSAGEKITPEAIEKSSAKLFPPNTVLMAMYGDGRTITSLGVLRVSAATNQACCAMIVDPEICDHLFLLYALKHHRQSLIQLALGGAQRNLSGTIIKNFAIAIPPLPIQHRIASILSAYDDLIENNTQRIKALEAAAQALYREWFVEFRFPGWQQVAWVDIGEGRAIPAECQWVKLGDIAKVKGGKRLPAGQTVQDEPTPYPYIRVRDFNPDGLDISNIKYITSEAHVATKRYVISNLDVYISIAGTIGRVGIIPDYLSGSNLTENAAKLCEIDEDIGQHYLMHYLRSEQGQGQIQRMTGGASQPKLALYRIEEIPILLPPREIAHTFNTLAGDAFRLQCKLQQRNRALRETRDLLLPRLISGEVSVEGLPQ